MEGSFSNNTELDDFFDFEDKADATNITSNINYCHKTTEVIFWILNSLIGAIILLGNSFTCVVFLSSKRLRQSYMNVFLISLACLDLLMAIGVVPFYAVYCSRGCRYPLGKYCWLFRATKDCVLLASTLNICAIAYDRYLAVIHPLHYGAKMTNRRVTAILGGVWLLPVVVAAIRSAWHHTKSGENLHFANKLYDIVLTFLFVLLSIIVSLFVNTKVMIAVKTHKERERNRRHLGRANDEELTRLRIRKGTRACIFVVFVYIACWLPRIVYNLSYVIKPPGLANPLFLKIAFFFLYLQSSANPFIYSFYRSEFRVAALRLIRWRSRRRIDPVLELHSTNFLSTT